MTHTTVRDPKNWRSPDRKQREARLRYAGVIRAAVLLLFVPFAVHAEDGETVIATLNDPVAECRSLRRLWLELRESIATAKSLIPDPEKVKRDLQSGRGSLQVVEMIRQEAEKELAIVDEKQRTFFAAVQALQAKRGKADPCPGITQDNYQEPAASPVPNPQGPSLEDHLKELDALRDNNLLTCRTRPSGHPIKQEVIRPLLMPRFVRGSIALCQWRYSRSPHIRNTRNSDDHIDLP